MISIAVVWVFCRQYFPTRISRKTGYLNPGGGGVVDPTHPCHPIIWSTPPPPRLKPGKWILENNELLQIIVTFYIIDC